jgi:hypothetical protein
MTMIKQKDKDEFMQVVQAGLDTAEGCIASIFFVHQKDNRTYGDAYFSVLGRLRGGEFKAFLSETLESVYVFSKNRTIATLEEEQEK